MKRIATIQEGIANLFAAADVEPISYQYIPASGDSVCAHIEAGDNSAPVFHWRYGILTHGLYGLVPQLGTPSVLKTWAFAPRAESMAQELFRELDYAEYLLRSRIVSIMGYGTKEAANFIIRMENGTVVNLETAVTLPPESRREARHTLYTTDGMASDLVTDNVVFQDQVHLIADCGNASFTDDDISLYGLSLEEQDICYSIFALLNQKEDCSAWHEQENRIKAMVTGALDCLKTGQKWRA